MRSPVQPILLVITLLLSSLALGCGDSIDSRLDEAFALQESGQLELSILAMQEILQDDPNHEKANFLLGTALVQSDRMKRAIPHLEAAAASDLYAVPAGLLLASTQYRIRAFDDAIESSRRVLELDPENLTAAYTLGLSYLSAGDPAAALEQAIRILEVKPGAHNASVMQGTALVNLGRSDEAEAIWLDLRQRTTAGSNQADAARACAELANFYNTQQDKARAEAIYTKCLGQYPTQAYLQKSASDFYIRLGQHERAIEIRRKAAEAAPNDLEVWSRLAAIMYLHGDPQSTHGTYLEIVERFDTPEAWRLIADFYQKTRHTTAARKAIEEALIRAEDPPEAYLYSLADLLVQEGNLERARQLGQRLTLPSYRNLLAGALSLADGNPKQALAQIDAGLRLWPNNPRGRYLAGEAALRIHDHDRAIAAFGAAIRVGDGATDAALRLAEIHYADGDFQSARGFAKHQIARRPYLDPTPYHIAIRSSLRLNHLKDAKEVLNALRVLDAEGRAVAVETIAILRFESGAQAAHDFVVESGIDLRNPANEPVLRAFADDLNSLGRGDEALPLVDAAIAGIDSDETAKAHGPALHDLRARLAYRLGRNDEAGKSIEAALAIDPNDAPALETRAFLLADAGDLPAALATLDAASLADPMNASYLYRAASIAADLGDSEGAISRLEQVLARRPHHQLAAIELAWALATERRDLDRALAIAQKRVEVALSPRTLMTLGWVQHRRGNHEGAIANYREALKADAALPAARYRLGLALAESGNENEARKVLEELVSGPAFPELDAARIELARLTDS